MEPTITLLCPNLQCRKVLSIPVSERGKVVRCKNCKRMVLVPAARIAAPAEAAPAQKTEKV